jgi:hypothetical protein
MSEQHVIYRAGMALLWATAAIAILASVCVGVLIWQSGDTIGLPWLFLPIILISGAAGMLAVLLLIVGALLGPKSKGT